MYRLDLGLPHTGHWLQAKRASKCERRSLYGCSHAPCLYLASKEIVVQHV